VIGGPPPNPEVGLQPAENRAVQDGGTVGLELEGDNGMARPSLSLGASQGGDVVPARERNSGVLIEEAKDGG